MHQSADSAIVLSMESFFLTTFALTELLSSSLDVPMNGSKGSFKNQFNLA